MSEPVSPDSPGESLISAHLRRFSGPLHEPQEPPRSTKPSFEQALLIPQAPPPKRLRAFGWLPWALAGLAIAFSMGRGTVQRQVGGSPSEVPASATALPESDSGRLVSQLLAQPVAGSNSHVREALPAPPATMSAADLKVVMTRFQGLSAGRYDPFRSVLSTPIQPSSPQVFVPKIPQSTLSPPPVALLVPTPLELPTPRPEPPVAVRLLGVVEGEESIALVEINRTGAPERLRLKRQDTLITGYHIFEIAPRGLVLKTASRTVVAMPIGTQVLLPVMASSSKVPAWNTKAASR